MNNEIKILFKEIENKDILNLDIIYISKLFLTIEETSIIFDAILKYQLNLLSDSKNIKDKMKKFLYILQIFSSNIYIIKEILDEHKEILFLALLKEENVNYLDDYILDIYKKNNLIDYNETINLMALLDFFLNNINNLLNDLTLDDNALLISLKNSNELIYNTLYNI